MGKYLFIYLTAHFLLSVSIAQAYGSNHYLKTFQVKITNGGNMPISPVIVYASKKSNAAVDLGGQASQGFLEICQTGNNTSRIEELKNNQNIKAISRGKAPILPGKSELIEIKVNPQKISSINVETMYGKSKDVCGVVNIGKESLSLLQYRLVKEVNGFDRPYMTGRFFTPNFNSSDKPCNEANDAAACLRSISQPKKDGSIKLFTGYLPSVLLGLEEKYGPGDASSLMIPTSGSIQYSISQK